MQQITAYARLYKVQHVALFNWDVLVLVRFPAVNYKKSAKATAASNHKVSDDCDLTIVTDPKDMRKALLGFLDEARSLFDDWDT